MVDGSDGLSCTIFDTSTIVVLAGFEPAYGANLAQTVYKTAELAIIRQDQNL